jgi:hypothetical protein
MRPAQRHSLKRKTGQAQARPLPSTLQGTSIMKNTATLLAGACAALALAMPTFAADDAMKASMKSADDSYSMMKKQAKADEKSSTAQCATMSGDAKSQCKKDAEATYKKTMADADATHDKAQADYKAHK